MKSGFNPRARAGRDPRDVQARRRLGLVSIHAPARGATNPPGIVAPLEACFNPRARAGRDVG